jgi:23S rRNA (cytidine1920-2'-O)/16S rRNA (cytidine1409-2'-O)-methyltransferase
VLEERLDKLLMARGLFSSRVRAEENIRQYGVLVNGKRFDKPGKKVPVDAKIQIVEEEIPWVSRAAYKLLHALELWNISVEEACCLDIGASTGGFTEVLLAKGAAKVYAVDVGQGQLHERLRQDKRVINKEKTHVRELLATDFSEPLTCCVVDVSFISLKKVFPFIQHLLEPDAQLVVLLKPQFEVGPAFIGKGGIVKDKTRYPLVISDIIQEAAVNNLEYISHVPSPLLGGDGNEEFLMHLRKRSLEA